MNILKLTLLSPVAILIAAGGTLEAQTSTGALSGRVLDAAGRAIAGARVSLESPALFQTKVFTTDAKGEYRAPMLPVGNYVIKASANGFIGKTAADFRVGLGSNLALDFALKPVVESGTTVEIVATAAQEAKTADKTSVNFSAQQLLQLPTSRSFDGALALAPGVSGSSLETNIRGGSSGGFSQVLYRIDGIDVKDDTGTAQDDQTHRAQLYQPLPDSIEDVEVVLSALNARNGRTQGGQVNVLTRTGGNEFAGSIRASMNRKSWTSNLSKGVVGDDVGSLEQNANEAFSRFTDVTFSGPIIKDRLWFYIGTRFQPKESGFNRYGWGGRVVDADGQTIEGRSFADTVRYPMTTFGRQPLLDAQIMGRTWTDASNRYDFALPPGYDFYNLATDSMWGQYIPKDVKYQKYEGKLTAMVTANHTLTATFLYDKATTTGMSGERSQGQWTLNKEFMGDQVDKTQAYTLSWNGTFLDKWFLEARLFNAKFTQEDVIGPRTHPVFVQSYLGTGNDPNVRIEQQWGLPDQQETPGVWYGPIFNKRSSGSLSPNLRGNRSLNVNMKTFVDAAGQHDIDFGFEQYETRHQFGRERESNMGVFNSGFIYNRTTGDYLYPTYWAHDEGSLLPLDESGYPDTSPLFVQYWDWPMRGPGVHIERYWSGAAEAKNQSRSFWVNDVWTINQNWNILAGVRLNQFQLYDVGGKSISKLSMMEPRFQIKFNPDGSGQEVYSFSAAKLASSYSDEMASNFRSNGWSVRTVHAWRGVTVNGRPQPAVEDQTALDPALRWVGYNELIDLNNYGPAVAIEDSRRNYVADGLKTPYAIEFTLGYMRNYDTGNVRINLVQRDYRQEWISRNLDGLPRVSADGNSMEYMTLVEDPSGMQGTPIWKLTRRFFNSSLSKIYRSVELSWQENLTSRLSFGGNYTYSQLTGRRASDYYSLRVDKLATGLSENEFAPEGVLSRNQIAHLFMTYVVPIGKGNVSASLLANYETAGVSSLSGRTEFHMPELPQSLHGATVDQSVTWEPQIYRNYFHAPGSFTSGFDAYDLSLKLQAQIPISKKIMLTTYVQVDNLLGSVQQHTVYDWQSGDYYGSGSDAVITGRPLNKFSHPWGYANDHTYYGEGRTVTSFSIGLKF